MPTPAHPLPQVRVATFLLQCACAGTLFWRLGDAWADVQARAGLLFFVTASLSFMAIATAPAAVDDLKVRGREGVRGARGARGARELAARGCARRGGAAAAAAAAWCWCSAPTTPARAPPSPRAAQPGEPPGEPPCPPRTQVSQRERAARRYGPGAYALAETLASAPFLLLLAAAAALPLYPAAGLAPGAERLLFFVLALGAALAAADSLMAALCALVPHFLMGLLGGWGQAGCSRWHGAGAVTMCGGGEHPAPPHPRTPAPPHPRTPAPPHPRTPAPPHPRHPAPPHPRTPPPLRPAAGAGLIGVSILTCGFFIPPARIPAPVWRYPLHNANFLTYAFAGGCRLPSEAAGCAQGPATARRLRPVAR